MPFSEPLQWHFNIDRYVNPFLPPNPFGSLPQPVARFFGNRDGARPQPHLGNIPMVFGAFVGVFCSIILIERVTQEVAFFQDHGAGIITGSFGAAAVLEFYSIDSPFAQPRNAVFGQIVSALVGTAVSKLFALNPDFESIRWLGGGVACASATAAMALTGTVHPPAGATALMAVVDNTAVRLGWVLVPVMMVGCFLMQCVALLVNNVLRKFPAYWWTPEEVGQVWKRKGGRDIEADSAKTEPALHGNATHHHTAALKEEDQGDARITITPGLVVVPEHLYLTPEEKLLLESVSQRL
ncbi:HPP family protein [Thozetella sp. PMI_491]|nr:HPP family protein [Thozetella sp. PMI_491]